MSKRKVFCWAIGLSVLSVAGVLIIPTLMQQCGVKLYKSSVSKDKIDFDSLGPEIVKKNAEGEDE